MLTKNLKPQSTKSKPVDLTLIEHLEELRRRLIICVIVVGIASIIAYFNIQPLLNWLIRPVGTVVFTKPTEAFTAGLKLAFFIGLFVSMPVILFHVWRFISPALHQNEKRSLFWVVPVSVVMFAIGMAFAYFVAIPAGLQFLLSYGTSQIQPYISVSSYISFLTFFVLAFGLIFQLPVAIALLSVAGFVSPKYLRQNRRFAIVAVFVVSAVFTPTPDVFNQCIMAIPLYILFEMSILLSVMLFKPSSSFHLH